jgi:GNAT superfamily N-acetyltransferase
MKLTFSIATPADAPPWPPLHIAAAADLTLRRGHGFWSSVTTERSVIANMRYARVVIARKGKTILGTIRLANKQPWAIDVSYFTPVKKAIYLAGMAVAPRLQRQGIGRQLLEQAVAQARARPAGAIRLDAFDADAGAGPFCARCGFRETARVAYSEALLIYFELVLKSALRRFASYCSSM